MRQGINVVFKNSIHKIPARIRDKSYFKKPERIGGDPQKRNQRWTCLFHEESGHITDNCRALKDFLDQLLRDGHLKEFVDEDKPQAKKAKARPNLRFDRGDDDTERTMDEEEDLPLGAIHMIGAPHHQYLENKIRGEI